MSNQISPANRPSDVYEAALLPEAPQFFHEASTNPLAVAGIQRNRLELDISLSCAPQSLEIDVDAYIAEIAPELGIARGKALEYVEVGIQLALMPRLGAFVKARAHLPFRHLLTIARATAPLQNPEVREVVEEEIARFVIPRRQGEVLRGIRSLHKFLQQVIEQIEPQLRPKNLPGDVDPLLPAGEREIVGESIGFEEGDNFAEVFMELEKTRALEFKTTLQAISTSAGCTRVEALTHLIRGTAEAKVVLNLYCPATEERPRTAWLGGVGWISQLATQAWIDKVTHIRLLADESAEGYTPTESQRAYIQGRDGTCRFPGCDVPAEFCDIDHIEPYNKENPAEGGATETPNLHCLCRRHHNMKTAGLWNVARDRDGVELWTSSSTGKKTVSMEDGPLAGHGRYTFDKRGLRMTQALEEYNQYRQELIEQSQKLVEEARKGEDTDSPDTDSPDTDSPDTDSPDTEDPPNMDEFGF
ncbi:HNH endonuclease signature motif containing protein [Corynebacterium amycolatum]|uniref:HNH endonuclease signature motif containing protein n=1 Tax=Corynebacterium amycolatum TaxID=43765 RepID=UPI00223BAF3B|nr:HNH endonuclease signature motif containing protein [Corynebacterium amycolatum]MCT1717927.1 HNH endonuclease [Corynebacterium amycolatum]MDK8819541.1 HNH endonuclease signature motif containing protein [Corynebacterium amycolatum]